MLGIIRPPRRPPGWQPIGPIPPAGAASRPDLLPRAGEDLCHLSGEWRILQRVEGHRWSLDDLVTAWLAADEVADASPRLVADLGCGIGSVLLMTAWRFPSARVVGVEAQDLSVDLARRSIAWNGVEDRCEVRLGDLRDASALPEGAVFDLVTGTPPYLPRGTANESRRVQWAPCHFEHRGGIEAYCAAASRLLAPRGRFVACASALQIDRVAASAKECSLAIVRRLDVVPRAGKAALFSVYALRRIDEGCDPLRIDPALVVRDAGGRRTDAFRTLRRAMGMPP
jgi:tRNA1(Val) A37 N6-methylase TrmN6